LLDERLEKQYVLLVKHIFWQECFSDVPLCAESAVYVCKHSKYTCTRYLWAHLNDPLRWQQEVTDELPWINFVSRRFRLVSFGRADGRKNLKMQSLA
jgi:hypothetical protein